MILLGVLVFAGKVLGCSGQTNRVELARRDGHHKSHRRTADTAGLSGTTGGQQKNGYSQIFGHCLLRGPRGTSGDRKDTARPAREIDGAAQPPPPSTPPPVRTNHLGIDGTAPAKFQVQVLLDGLTTTLQVASD